MTIVTICPECGKRHEVDAVNAGRHGKCKGCGAVMVVPDAPVPSTMDETIDEDDAYGLVESPVEKSEPSPSFSRVVPTPEPARSFHRSGLQPSKQTRNSRDRNEQEDDLALVILRRMPLVLGLVALVMIVLAVAVPGGTRCAGALASILGLFFALATFWVGAFAAFREDWLYGFGYVFFPFYTAYYIVTRFDDLKNWVFLGLIGLILATVGGALFESGSARAAKVVAFVAL